MTGRHIAARLHDPRISGDGRNWSTFLLDCGVLDSSLDPVFERWIKALRRNSGAAVGAFYLSDADHRIVRSVCTASGSLHRVTPTHADSRASGLLSLLPGFDPGAGPEPGTGRDRYAEATVMVTDRVIGQVAIAGPGPHGWAPGTAEALQDAAAAVSTEVALRIANHEAEQVQLLVASHYRVHDMIGRAAPLRDVLVEICETIERYDASLIPCVLMLDPVSSTLHSGVGPSLPADYLAATDGLVIGPNIGSCGAAAWSGRLVVSADLAEDPRWAPAVELSRRAGVAHCWSMPIKGAEGQVLGTLAFYGRRPREPLPAHLALLHDWARVAGIAIERSQTLYRLTYDARHDGLTGLPNRLAIFEELDDAILRACRTALAAVLFVDLDGLKALNDTLGHDRADEMIQEIAVRLSKTVEGDFVGRFGGDEFIVIVEGVTDPQQVGELGERLLDAIAQPLPGLTSTVVTASIGVALIRDDAVDARTAIGEADAAMYAAKRSGRDRCVFSQAGVAARSGRRLQIARELQGAQTRGEMRLVFQPVIRSTTMEIVGVEALLRWTSPTLGPVEPSEFIPIAEDTGSIVPIGAWVLRESCETIVRLTGSDLPLELDVNVSARQVSNPDFSLWVRQILSHADLPAARLGLEITETALMRPDALTARILRELDSLGVRIVLDDFGTGYSSLSWLKQHQFGAIKIDQGFVGGLPDDRGDRAIVAGVIDMAKALGCTITAEGVESERQLATLRELGCERVQGFLLGRPVDADGLADLLARHPLRGRRPACP